MSLSFRGGSKIKLNLNNISDEEVKKKYFIKDEKKEYNNNINDEMKKLINKFNKSRNVMRRIIPEEFKDLFKDKDNLSTVEVFNILEKTEKIKAIYRSKVIKENINDRYRSFIELNEENYIYQILFLTHILTKDVDNTLFDYDDIMINIDSEEIINQIKANIQLNINEKHKSNEEIFDIFVKTLRKNFKDHFIFLNENLINEFLETEREFEDNEIDEDDEETIAELLGLTLEEFRESHQYGGYNEDEDEDREHKNLSLVSRLGNVSLNKINRILTSVGGKKKYKEKSAAIDRLREITRGQYHSNKDFIKFVIDKASNLN